jgi:cytochrome c oxidase subunit 3
MTAVVTAEARRQGIARTGLLAALASETVFFGTLLSAYLFMRLGQPGWPQVATTPARIVLPALNTLVLLVSALAVVLGERALVRGSARGLSLGLGAALVLGLVFVGGQIAEFTSNGMQPGDQAFGGVFFTLMGFHAVHVLAGAVWLAINLVRTRLGDFTSARHISISMGTWFWIYVTCVWLTMFIGLYLV